MLDLSRYSSTKEKFITVIEQFSIKELNLEEANIQKVENYHHVTSLLEEIGITEIESLSVFDDIFDNYMTLFYLSKNQPIEKVRELIINGQINEDLIELEAERLQFKEPLKKEIEDSPFSNYNDLDNFEPKELTQEEIDNPWGTPEEDLSIENEDIIPGYLKFSEKDTKIGVLKQDYFDYIHSITKKGYQHSVINSMSSYKDDIREAREFMYCCKFLRENYDVPDVSTFYLSFIGNTIFRNRIPEMVSMFEQSRKKGLELVFDDVTDLFKMDFFLVNDSLIDLLLDEGITSITLTDVMGLDRSLGIAISHAKLEPTFSHDKVVKKLMTLYKENGIIHSSRYPEALSDYMYNKNELSQEVQEQAPNVMVVICKNDPNKAFGSLGAQLEEFYQAGYNLNIYEIATEEDFFKYIEKQKQTIDILIVASHGGAGKPRKYDSTAVVGSPDYKGKKANIDRETIRKAHEKFSNKFSTKGVSVFDVCNAARPGFGDNAIEGGLPASFVTEFSEWVSYGADDFQFGSEYSFDKEDISDIDKFQVKITGVETTKVTAVPNSKGEVFVDKIKHDRSDISPVLL